MAKTDPPLISVPAAVVARLKGARLVNWCQDLFPETAAALGLCWAGGRLGQLLQKLRNWSLRGAECNVVLCDEMLSYLNSEGLPKQSLRVIHNWPAQSIALLPRVRQSNEPFTIVYSGNLGRAHSVESIIDLIKRTRHLPLHWLFIGGGAGRERLRQVATEGAFGNVTLAPYATVNALSQSLANADLHLVSLDPACEGLIMPSKLYGIMAAGRPTVFVGNPEGAVAQILRTHAAGMTLDGARPETYLPALEALVKNPDRLAAMGRNARRAFERHYSAEHSLKAWFDVLIGAPAPSDLAIRPERTAT